MSDRLGLQLTSFSQFSDNSHLQTMFDDARGSDAVQLFNYLTTVRSESFSRSLTISYFQ